MAFWGVEVRPGKPYTHIHDSNRGILRLSQVTLGNGEATKRSVLQCNVGKKSPVLLCSLLPDRAESSCVDLQFEESEEVVFSVVGPRSVHLAGYFLGGSSRHGGGNASDSDSYGEDIGETSDESGSHSSEDKYESDFIDDDDDIEMTSSPRASHGAVIDEIMEDEKTVNRNPSYRRLRKKNQVSDSDEGDVGSQRQIVVNHGKPPVSESEEEEGCFPISFSVGKKNTDRDGKSDNKILDADKKRKLDVVAQDKGFVWEDEAVAVSNGKSKKKKKDRIKSAKSLETDADIPDESIRHKQQIEDQIKYADDKRVEAQPCEGENEKINRDHANIVVVAEISGKLKKKKKNKGREGETPETRVELTVDKFEGASTEEIDTMNNIQEVNIGSNDNDPLVKGGHQGVTDEKEVLGSSDKLNRKKKKTKDKSSFDEENRSETSQKDRDGKSQSVEVIRKEASKSNKKINKDQPVSGMPSEMTASVNDGPVPADICHEPNKKKQKKKNR